MLMCEFSPLLSAGKLPGAAEGHAHGRTLWRLPPVAEAPAVRVRLSHVFSSCSVQGDR